MIFGPFDISNESLTSVEFVESYVYGEATLDSNLVEISIDGGDNWETVFVLSLIHISEPTRPY